MASIKKTKFVDMMHCGVEHTYHTARRRTTEHSDRKWAHKGILIFLYTAPPYSYLVAKYRIETAFENFKEIQTQPFRLC